MISYADRVWETSTTTGTGDINLDGALQSYQTFVEGAGGGSKVPYIMFDDTNWEQGRGTVTAGTPDTLSRDVVIEGTNGTSPVNWGPGTRNVMLPVSTYFAVWRDENLNYTGDFGTSGGTGDVQTLTFSPQRLGLSDGMIVTWVSPGTNTTDVTINIDGLGDKDYVDADGNEFPAGTVTDEHIQQAVYVLADDKFYRTTLLNRNAEIPQNSKSADYTLVAGDAGEHIYHPSSDTDPRTWTIPANASVAFPVGTAITFVNDDSAGDITIAITSDTLVQSGTGDTGSRTLAENGNATILKVASTRWVISGVELS